MRKVWLLLLLAPSALVYACGGDDSKSDGGSDAANDNTTNPDTGGGDAAKDTSTNDTGTDTGPGDAGNDVSFTVTCLKPADCIDGGNPDAAYPPDSGEVCCATVQTSGTFPNCSLNAASTKCSAPSACASQFALSCGTDTARLCTNTTECTEGTYNDCCSADLGDAGTIHLCFNKALSNQTGGKIVCP